MRRGPESRPKQQKTLASSLVALSSAAVIAVYAAGYERTAPAAGQLAAVAAAPDAGAAVEPAPTATAPSATATPAPTSTSIATAAPAITTGGEGAAAQRGGRQRSGETGQLGGGGAAQPTTPPTATATASPPVVSSAPATSAAAFRDGTYTGTGTSRHGSIGVTVTVQGGKITAAEITDCGTRYPCSEIAALPGQVVARQSAGGDRVSGATDSTNAYRAAVNAALAQAR